MSYHRPHQLGALAPAVQPHLYPLPLAQVPSSAPAIDSNTRKILVFLGLVLLAFIVWSMMSKKKPVTRNAAVKRLTTPELAANLYSRLEKKKGTKPETLRSLASYASKR